MPSYDYEGLDCWVEKLLNDNEQVQGFVWNAKGFEQGVLENVINYNGILDSDFYIPWALEIQEDEYDANNNFEEDNEEEYYEENEEPTGDDNDGNRRLLIEVEDP